MYTGIPPTFRSPKNFIQSVGLIKTRGSWEERADGDNSVAGIPAANRKAFLAFSGGARSCPGQNFALQEAVVVLFNLRRAFEFRTQPDYEVEPIRRGLVQHPRGGMPMTIRPRILDSE